MALASASLAEYLMAELAARDGDVTLVLGEGDAQETFMAHSVLLRRAEYFRTALQPLYKEGQTNSVELPDVSPTLMKALVKALYCDSFSHLTSDSGDADSGLSPEQLFELCQLAERFLVPVVVMKCAYDTYARCVLDRGLSSQEYVDVFAQLAGTRVPSSSMDTLLAGFRTRVEAEQWTVEPIMSLVVEASLKKVDARVQILLKATLVKSVTFGTDLTEGAVRAAKQGMLDSAEGILDRIAYTTCHDRDFRDKCDRERGALHRESVGLPKHEEQYLKAMYAIRTLPKLEEHLRWRGWFDAEFRLDDAGSRVTKLLGDIEAATAGLFTQAAALPVKLPAASPQGLLCQACHGCLCQATASPIA